MSTIVSDLNSGHSAVESMQSRYNIQPSDLDLIRTYGEQFAARLDAFINAFYEWLENMPEFEEFFDDETTVVRVKASQVEYWKQFMKADLNEAYVRSRAEIGHTHAAIGLPVHSYTSGMNFCMNYLFTDISKNLKGKGAVKEQTMASIAKLANLDTAIVVQAYSSRTNEVIAEQSKTLMEMSTPVTEIWEDILMLPVVGIIDSKRAQDIMDAVLTTISRVKARNFILDISGVAVVDTAVANHLINITKATRLMGCEAIISGVSPAIAQTVVELGIDVGTVRTTSNMKDALSDAFGVLGIRVIATS